uniref:RNA-directed DNA polymerase, eukaryota n=1 Tax=Tanacetum cinerariifolium TaxID=118510 RepID=A0A6L2NU28_TANCI|nr:RNA-directed DNA polymerase, eukaryota [Tanacetum cinerariifolium]
MTSNGNHGALNCSSPNSRRSPWLDIIHETNSLLNKGIDLLTFIRKNVRNGTLFGDGTWLGEKSLKYQFSRLYALDECKLITVAEKTRHGGLSSFYRRPRRGGAEEDQQSLLQARVTDLVLPQDRWTWSLDSSCDYSMKSIRNLIDDYILPSKYVPTRWVKVIPIKINIFAWRVFLDKLHTRLDLSFRGVVVSSILCPLCDASVESSSHLFFTCPLVCQVRSKVSHWWELDDTVLHSYDGWLTWFNNIRLSKNLKALYQSACSPPRSPSSPLPPNIKKMYMSKATHKLIELHISRNNKLKSKMEALIHDY